MYDKVNMVLLSLTRKGIDIMTKTTNQQLDFSKDFEDVEIIETVISAALGVVACCCGGSAG